MDEKKSLFRQKAIDRISSPEKFDSYLKVTSPGVWIVLCAVIVLLLGVCVWGFLGRIDTECSVAVVVEEGSALCYLPAELPSLAEEAVTINGVSYAISYTGLAPVEIGAQTDYRILTGGDYTAGSYAVPYVLREAPADGTYTGTVLVESVRPISFILN